MNIRELYLKKESIRKKLEGLWTLRDTREWSKEEREQYDQHKTEADQISSDLKLRSEYIESF